MNIERLKKTYYLVYENAGKFDMHSTNADIGYFAATLACGEDLKGQPVVEYRGQLTHVEDIAEQFLQLSENESDILFYLGRWPNPAWNLYRKGETLKALLYTINSLVTR